MKILFLSYWLPLPADNGSKLRIYHLLRGLAQQHDITLLALADSIPAERDSAFAEICAAVHVRRRPVYRPGSLKALAGLLSPTPRSLVDTYDPAVARLISDLRTAQAFDVAIVSELGMSAYVPALAGLPVILDDLEIGLLRSLIQATPPGWRRRRQALPWFKLRPYLRRLLPRLRAVTVVSEPERALLASVAPGYSAVTVLPNGVDTERLKPDPTVVRRPERLIFTGSLRYHANYGAMVWFLEEVLPRVQARRPSVELLITGDHGGLPLPPASGVTLTGRVPEVAALVQSAAVSVAPLRVGGGTRLKILEAMALGTPVVATSLGAEGLEVVSGEHLLVADSAETQARAILDLIGEPAYGAQLTARARCLVEEHYSWPGLWHSWLRLVTQSADVRALS